MGKREAALTLYVFPQPVSGVGASRLSGAQKRQRGGKELAIQAFPEVGFLRGQRDGLSLSLSPFPHPYIALSLPLLSIPPPSAWQHPHKPPSPRQAGLPACRPRCAKRGSGKERKAASEGERWGFGRKGGLPSLSLLRWAGSEKASLSLRLWPLSSFYRDGSSGGVMDFLPFGLGSRKRPR